MPIKSTLVSSWTQYLQRLPVQALFHHLSPLLGLSCPIFPPAGGEDVAEVEVGAGLYQRLY